MSITFCFNILGLYQFYAAASKMITSLNVFEFTEKCKKKKKIVSVWNNAHWTATESHDNIAIFQRNVVIIMFVVVWGKNTALNGVKGAI